VKKEITYNVSSISLDGEDDCCANHGCDDGTNGPEECQAVEHRAEALASLVTEVQSLAELGTTGSVNSADVFNIRVDTRTERRALG